MEKGKFSTKLEKSHANDLGFDNPGDYYNHLSSQDIDSLSPAQRNALEAEKRSSAEVAEESKTAVINNEAFGASAAQANAKAWENDYQASQAQAQPEAENGFGSPAAQANAEAWKNDYRSHKEAQLEPTVNTNTNSEAILHYTVDASQDNSHSIPVKNNKNIVEPTVASVKDPETGAPISRKADAAVETKPEFAGSNYDRYSTITKTGIDPVTGERASRKEVQEAYDKIEAIRKYGNDEGRRPKILDVIKMKWSDWRLKNKLDSEAWTNELESRSPFRKMLKRLGYVGLVTTALGIGATTYNTLNASAEEDEQRTEKTDKSYVDTFGATPLTQGVDNALEQKTSDEKKESEQQDMFHDLYNTTMATKEYAQDWAGNMDGHLFNDEESFKANIWAVHTSNAEIEAAAAQHLGYDMQGMTTNELGDKLKADPEAKKQVDEFLKDVYSRMANVKKVALIGDYYSQGATKNTDGSLDVYQSKLDKTGYWAYTFDIMDADDKDKVEQSGTIFDYCVQFGDKVPLKNFQVLPSSTFTKPESSTIEMTYTTTTETPPEGEEPKKEIPPEKETPPEVDDAKKNQSDIWDDEHNDQLGVGQETSTDEEATKGEELTGTETQPEVIQAPGDDVSSETNVDAPVQEQGAGTNVTPEYQEQQAVEQQQQQNQAQTDADYTGEAANSVTLQDGTVIDMPQ